MAFHFMLELNSQVSLFNIEPINIEVAFIWLRLTATKTHLVSRTQSHFGSHCRWLMEPFVTLEPLESSLGVKSGGWNSNLRAAADENPGGAPFSFNDERQGSSTTVVWTQNGIVGVALWSYTFLSKGISHNFNVAVGFVARFWPQGAQMLVKESDKTYCIEYKPNVFFTWRLQSFSVATAALCLILEQRKWNAARTFILVS